MTFHSLGDLAGQLMLSSARLRADQNLTRLSQELTTGIASDTGRQLRNDFSALTSWEKSISSAEVREKTLAEATSRLQAKQHVLGAIGNTVLELAGDISLVTTTGSESDQQAVSERAKELLTQTLSLLNTRASGQTVFAGAASDGPAMADGNTVLASIKAAVLGAVTAQDLTLAVDVWMGDPVSGFDAVAYLGSDADAQPIRVENGRTIDSNGKGDDPAIKAVVKALITAALAFDPDVALTGEGPVHLLNGAANDMRNAQAQLAHLEAGIGQKEAEATRALAFAKAEISMARMLRNDALSVDQYETASRLKETELQLEKIYMLTARSARLSLLEYLR